MPIESATRYLFLAFLISSAALFTICRAAAIQDPEVEDQRHFTYGEQDHKGPKKWGQINPEWSVCNSGKLQSPIDMSNKRVQLKTDKDLQVKYRPGHANVTNRGHDIVVHWEGDAGGIRINGTDYKLVQVHWHTPSEHTVDGKRYDMEAHIVHKSADSGIAVVAIFYTIGSADRFLGKILTHIKELTDKFETGKDWGIINPREVRFNKKQYYRYLGSLTTPPCTEGVIWTVISKVKTVSLEQLHSIRKAVKDGYETNARPIQI